MQNSVVQCEQGVNIVELRANAQVKKVRGEAEAYRVGVAALGTREFTGLQLRQIIGLLAQQQTAQLSNRNQVAPVISPKAAEAGAASDSAI